MSQEALSQDSAVQQQVPYEASPLVACGLSDEDLKALSRQGFVCEEADRGRTYFKLRFRRDGRQIVRYLGRDPVRAAAVREELAALQWKRRRRLALARILDETRKALRLSKRTLAPELAEVGYRFHGYAVRKSRRNCSQQILSESDDPTSNPSTKVS